METECRPGRCHGVAHPVGLPLPRLLSTANVTNTAASPLPLSASVPLTPKSLFYRALAQSHRCDRSKRYRSSDTTGCALRSCVSTSLRYAASTDSQTPCEPELLGIAPTFMEITLDFQPGRVYSWDGRGMTDSSAPVYDEAVASRQGGSGAFRDN